MYEQGSFTPIAKLVNAERFSIVSDYLGTPIQAYDSEGELIWERELTIYGSVRKETGVANFVPMRYQGQYFDQETGLCYNRFRYFDSATGLYISQDPIGIAGGMALYRYVKDSNVEVDVLGLLPLSNAPTIGHHMVPHTPATKLAIQPFNSKTGVPSLFIATGIEHSALHGYNGIGSDTRPFVHVSDIQDAGMTNDQWLRSLETHYNNPAIQHVRGNLHIISSKGTKGALIRANVSPAEAWELTKEWAANQGFEICK